jgi:hypothetical protein
MNFSKLPQDEQEDINSSLKDRDLNLSEFEFDIRENSPPPGVSAISGEIIAKYKNSGVSRTYKYGFGTAWTAEFERDLAANLFRIT